VPAGSRVHSHGDIGLGQGRGVIGAVPGHGHQAPACLVLADQLQLTSGVAWARKSSTPASAAMAAAVTGLSPVIITVLIPMRLSWAKRSGFTFYDVFEVNDSYRLVIPGHNERRSPRAAMAVYGIVDSPGIRCHSSPT